MLPRVAFSILFLCAGWLASARATELYDPNLMPYDPRPVPFPECGFSIGLDKNWIFETKEKTQNGATGYFYHFKSNIKLNPRPFDVFVFNPQLNGYLKCATSIDKKGKPRTGKRLQKFVQRFADSFRKGQAEEGKFLNFSELQEIKIAGLDVAYIFHADIPPEKGTEFKSRGVAYWLAGGKGSVFVNGLIQLRDPVGGKKRLPKGTTAREQTSQGKIIEVKLANDATVVDSVFYGSRTLAQDRNYIMTLLRSIR